jgi:nitrous oxide reductase accessory protein NosL
MVGMMVSAFYNLVGSYFVGVLGTSQQAAVAHTMACNNLREENGGKVSREKRVDFLENNITDHRKSRRKPLLLFAFPILQAQPLLSMICL